MLDTRAEHVHALIAGLMSEHGLTARGWVYRFDTAVSRAGCCYFATRTIALSKHLALSSQHDMKHVKNIILHEIAHALAGPAAAHGPVWRETALRIGCDGCRCLNMEIMPHRIVLVCVLCGHMNGLRHRVHRSFWINKRCSSCAAAGSVTVVPRKVWDDVNLNM